MQVPEYRSDWERANPLEGTTTILAQASFRLRVGGRDWDRTALIAIANLVLLLGGAVCAAQAPSAEEHANKATELVQAGNLKEAESELRSAVDLAPDDASLRATLGTVLAMQRRFEESTEVFKPALKMTPNDVTVRRYLAANLWQLHRYAKPNRTWKPS